MSEFKIPEYAKGTIIPNSVLARQLEEEKEKALRRKQFIHDWKIAIFSTLGGAIAGFLTSLIFWLVSK